MNTQTSTSRFASLAAAAFLLLGATGTGLAANHLVDGITGPDFTLVATNGYLSTPEGNSLYFWGYGTLASGKAQYSGPTLIVTEGQTVNVTLKNALPVPTSMVFPGQSGVTATPALGGSTPGLLTLEPNVGGSAVKYTFVAGKPGTYMYHSGTQPDLQIEMGMVGALIVRPAGFNPASAANRKAYNAAGTEFDHEFLFLLSDMDDKIHDAVEKQVQAGAPVNVDMSTRFAVYWFINGRCGPDTMLPAGHPSLDTQPYDCFPLFHPGEKVMMRVIGGGSDEHPLHHHGNHARMIAQDGRLLESVPGVSGPDLGNLEFTVPSTPGSTIDTIFSWTGAGLGWDAYGHKPGDPLAPNESPADHATAEHPNQFPVILPAPQNIVDGMMYGGSPFLGSPGLQKPGEGGFNSNNGFMYLWHSHAEKEIVNNDIFPGGMMTFALIEAWPVAP